jgi:hypothetical protein
VVHWQLCICWHLLHQGQQHQLQQQCDCRYPQMPGVGCKTAGCRKYFMQGYTNSQLCWEQAVRTVVETAGDRWGCNTTIGVLAHTMIEVCLVVPALVVLLLLGVLVRVAPAFRDCMLTIAVITGRCNRRSGAKRCTPSSCSGLPCACSWTVRGAPTVRCHGLFKCPQRDHFL